MDARRSHRAGYTGATLRALGRWLRTVTGGRRSADSVVRAAESSEDTGIWGVGGPAMREPGSTGIARALQAPRDNAD
jgi:hypothetical protein